MKEQEIQEQIAQVHAQLDQVLSDHIIDAALVVFGSVDNTVAALNGGAFMGEYATVEEYARVYAAETDLLSDWPSSLVHYFDFEKFGRDMEKAGDIIHEGGCVFLPNY